MPDRGIELRQLGALARELAEQGREADVVLVDQCSYAGTFDVPCPPHLIEKLRELWETSKASKREWTLPPAETAGGSTSTSVTAPVSEPRRVH